MGLIVTMWVLSKFRMFVIAFIEELVQHFRSFFHFLEPAKVFIFKMEANFWELPVVLEMFIFVWFVEIDDLIRPRVCYGYKRYFQLLDKLRHNVLQVCDFILDRNCQNSFVWFLIGYYTPNTKSFNRIPKQFLFFLNGLNLYSIFENWMFKIIFTQVIQLRHSFFL